MRREQLRGVSVSCGAVVFEWKYQISDGSRERIADPRFPNKSPRQMTFLRMRIVASLESSEFERGMISACSSRMSEK
jgi:hypothetical protein